MENELRFLGGDLLFDGGSLAMSEDCCCNEPEELTGTCNGRTFTFPSFFVVDFRNVGDYDDSTPAGCDECDVVGGVRELAFDSIMACGAFTTGYCRLVYAQDLGAVPGCGTVPYRYLLLFDLPCTGTGNILLQAATQPTGTTFLSNTVPFTTNLMGFTITLPNAAPGSGQCDIAPATVDVL